MKKDFERIGYNCIISIFLSPITLSFLVSHLLPREIRCFAAFPPLSTSLYLSLLDSLSLYLNLSISQSQSLSLPHSISVYHSPSVSQYLCISVSLTHSVSLPTFDYFLQNSMLTKEHNYEGKSAEIS